MRRILRFSYRSDSNPSLPLFLLRFRNTRRPRLTNASRVRDGLRTCFFAQRISPRANRTHPRRQDYQPAPINF